MTERWRKYFLFYQLCPSMHVRNRIWAGLKGDLPHGAILKKRIFLKIFEDKEQLVSTIFDIFNTKFNYGDKNVEVI